MATAETQEVNETRVLGYRGRALLLVSVIMLLLSLNFLLHGVNEHNKTIERFIAATEDQSNYIINDINQRSLVYYGRRLDTFLQINSEIIKAFAARDRERLFSLVLPKFEILHRENHHFQNIQFHLPDGHSFLRMNDPEFHDDDLLEMRPSIRRIHAEKKRFSCFEVDRDGGLFRSLAPVMYDGRYVGAVEFDLSMHQAVELMESILNLQVTSFITAEEWQKATSYDKFPMVKIGNYMVNSHGHSIYRKLPAGLQLNDDSHLRVEIDGAVYIVHSHSVLVDAKGDTVGGLLVLQDINTLAAEKKTFLVRAVFFTAVLLGLGYVLLYFTINPLLKAMGLEIERRKSAEERFREAKTFLECVIDSIPDPIYYKDRNRCYLGCNRAFSRLTGMEPEDLTGKDDGAVFPSILADFFSHDDQITIASGGAHSSEGWLRQEEKPPLYMHTIKTPYLGPGDNLIGVIGISRDMTRYKEATETIEKAAREWEAAMNVEKDAIYILDLDRHLLQANASFYRMMGGDSLNWPGHHISNLLHPQGEPVPCPVCEAQEKRRDAHIVMEADHPNNPTNLPLEFTVAMVRNREGQPLSIFMRIHDLTEQRAVENSLRRSKEEWERTFNSLSDLVTIQDKDMRIIRANRATEVFFGMSQDELAGKFCYQLFRGDDTPCVDCPVLASPGKYGPHPSVVKHDNLKKFFHLSSSVLRNDNDGSTYLVHVARDITVQKELEEELFQAHKMEAIGTLAGGIAHDFNNILAAIIGFSELVKNDLANNRLSEEDIDEVLRAADRARGLVRQILSFSRKVEHQLQLIEPYCVVREVVKMLRSTLPSTVNIEENLNPDAGTIKADPVKIHQVVVNLCTNAFQAMENEKGVLRISLQRREIRSAQNGVREKIPAGTYIELEVSDNGQGITPENRGHIFEPFFSTKAVGEGTGLGLSVIHGIIKDYNGFIEVESSPGNGATFHVFLPACDEGEKVAVDTGEPSGIGLEGGCEKIMVVDDDPLLVRINSRILGNLGYLVTPVTSSEEALAMIRRKPQMFDMLITDQTMPGLTGLELANAAMEISPEIKIIMVTGHSGIVSADEAIAQGISRYIFKPIQGTELVDAVREVLGGSKSA